MNGQNYQKKLDTFINECMQRGSRPRVLVHSCCAPCASYVMEYMSRFFELTMYFYNPNIDTLHEYRKRMEELGGLIPRMKLSSTVRLVTEDYDPLSFEAIAKGHENDPERGFRCKLCYRLRLKKTAAYMQKVNASNIGGGYDFFATTLTLSPLKDANVINEIGGEISKELNVRYLDSDFKKRDGYKRSIELSKEFGLYRQNYCGCSFSQYRQNEKGAD